MAGFNRILNFIGVLDNKEFECMNEIGQFCKSKMDEYVPVDTGYLKSRNDFKVTKFFHRKLTLINDAPYAGYVEMGTYKMQAQPFIRPAMENHISEINAITRRVYGDI